eukprot:1142961-Pelagomonas_calceolata.AAC.4
MHGSNAQKPAHLSARRVQHGSGYRRAAGLQCAGSQVGGGRRRTAHAAAAAVGLAALLLGIVLAAAVHSHHLPRLLHLTCRLTHRQGVAVLHQRAARAL